MEEELVISLSANQINCVIIDDKLSSILARYHILEQVSVTLNDWNINLHFIQNKSALENFIQKAKKSDDNIDIISVKTPNIFGGSNSHLISSALSKIGKVPLLVLGHYKKPDKMNEFSDIELSYDEYKDTKIIPNCHVNEWFALIDEFYANDEGIGQDSVTDILRHAFSYYYNIEFSRSYQRDVSQVLDQKSCLPSQSIARELMRERYTKKALLLMCDVKHMVTSMVDNYLDSWTSNQIRTIANNVRGEKTHVDNQHFSKGVDIACEVSIFNDLKRIKDFGVDDIGIIRTEDQFSYPSRVTVSSFYFSCFRQEKSLDFPEHEELEELLQYDMQNLLQYYLETSFYKLSPSICLVDVYAPAIAVVSELEEAKRLYMQPILYRMQLKALIDSALRLHYSRPIKIFIPNVKTAADVRMVKHLYSEIKETYSNDEQISIPEIIFHACFELPESLLFPRPILAEVDGILLNIDRLSKDAVDGNKALKNFTTQLRELLDILFTSEKEQARNIDIALKVKNAQKKGVIKQVHRAGIDTLILSPQERNVISAQLRAAQRCLLEPRYEFDDAYASVRAEA